MMNKRRSRIINTSRILHEIWSAGRTTRVDISRKLGLNKSTITNIVDELIEKQIILEGSEGVAGPRGGRKPVKITINKRYGYVLGFELRPDSYTVLAVDLQGDILFTKSEDSLEIQSEGLKPLFLDRCRHILEELSWLDIPLLGIGVGISGIIDSDNRIIKGSIPLGITEPFDFYREICSEFNVPVFIENDANCGAWGELVFHRHSSPQNFLFVLLEFWKRVHSIEDVIQPAIGMGIVIGGKIHRGRSGSAGEFKSVFSSHEKKNHQIEAVSDPRNMFDLERDPEILGAYMEELCKNLALMVNTFNLDQVYFGGDTEICRETLPSLLSREIDNNWVYESDVNCEVRFSSMGRNTVCYGAAGLVLDKLFIDLETLNSLDLDRKNDFYLLRNELHDQPMKG